MCLPLKPRSYPSPLSSTVTFTHLTTHTAALLAPKGLSEMWRHLLWRFINIALQCASLVLGFPRLLKPVAGVTGPFPA